MPYRVLGLCFMAALAFFLLFLGGLIAVGIENFHRCTSLRQRQNMEWSPAVAIQKKPPYTQFNQNQQTSRISVKNITPTVLHRTSKALDSVICH